MRRRVDLDEILRRGLSADLDSDEACLVLATVLKMDILDRGDLRTAVEVVFEQHRGDIDFSRRIDLDAAIDRLLDTGHLTSAGEQLKSCACRVTSALLRNIDEVLADLVGRIDAAIGVQEQAYEAVLALALHHAKDSLLSDEEIRAEAWKDARKLMSSTDPVDLRALCRNLVREADQEDVDLIWMSAEDEPVWVEGPRIWIDCLIKELLNNAITATASVPHDDLGSVYMEVNVSGTTAELVVNDDGPGFPQDFLESFEAGRPVRRADQPGRGNGLNRCRRSAQLHDVVLAAETGADGGAVMRVRFPLVARPDRA